MRGTAYILRNYGTILFTTLFSLLAQSQSLNWANKRGGSNSDIGYSTTKDLNGNIVHCGSFASSNVDFDPGAGVFTLSSSGDYDIFVSKLSPTGQFIWAFKVGGGLRDEAYSVVTDAVGDVYITGYFRGSNVDFDPGAATFLLSSNGDSGVDPGWGGDIFIAKYNSAGQFLWAKNFGGTTLYDSGTEVEVDPGGNVYFGGYFNGTIDLDAGPGTANLDWNTGRLFLAKYNSAGQYVWAINFGTAGNVDNNVYGLQWAPSGNIYVSGFYQGSNIDFDPGPGVSTLTSNGSYEFYLAKFNDNGQFQWARSAGGSGADVARAMAIDNAENIYVTGDYRSASMDFDLSSAGGLITNAGSGDIFFVKYNSAGQNIYAYGFGGTNDDYGLSVTLDNTYVYIGGTFSGANVDFDPTASTSTLTSNGGTDIYYSKYLLNGQFLCAFNIGGSGNDQCRSLISTGLNKINATGFFQNTNIDFDPSTTGTTLLSSSGSEDAYVADYTWPEPTPPNGTITGNTICTGEQAQLTFNSTAGTGPFTLVYNDGANNITVTNIQSGVPFNVSPNPLVTTTYTLVSIKDAQRCAPITLANGTTTITINSCTQTIINDYSPVLSLDPCKNIINVGDASAFNVGDTVLLIQMKGAVIDSTNTSSFGNVTNYKNAGNYEYNYIKSKNGNSIELLNKIERQYDLPGGKVQLITVPYFQNYTVNNTLTCLPWDGNKGGVLVFNVRDTLTFQNDIDVQGKGFNGGVMRNAMINSFTCANSYYYYPINTPIAAGKGESIADLDSTKNAGMGKKASGGGGGLDPNTGGGGGGNGNSGGRGGYGYQLCPNYTTNNTWGLGGIPLAYNTIANKIFLAGGGGAGHCNNGFEDPSANTDFNGGNGGGIVIISSNYITGNNRTVKAMGNTAYELAAPGFLAHDGMGGGGAGGTVLIKNNNYISNLTVNVRGGKGGNMSSSTAGGTVGPGGGGAGGVLWLSQPSLPTNVNVINSGGTNGIIIETGSPYGATPGAAGINVFNLKLAIDSTLFKPNIDSVRIKDSIKTCTDFDFKGLGYTNTNPIASWQWYFGDGGTANTQNTSHNYAAGTYTVKLVVTDINGCKDSITRNIIASTLTVNVGNDTTICSGQSIVLPASSNGATQFLWTPASFLNNNSILNPTATPPAGTTMFYLTATNAAGCFQKDSLSVFVRAQNTFSVNAPSPVCKNDSVQLMAKGGDTYSWQPSTGINSTIFNPFVSPQITTTYTVQITDTLCAFTQVLSTQVVVLSLPNVQAFKQNDIDCIQNTARLNASGAVNYIWTPAATLNNPNIASPIATPTTSILYTVEGTDAAGCKNSDTISVIVDYSIKNGLYLMPNAFTPNNDGLNDCFGIKFWGTLTELEFNIYNRWGQLIFHTTDQSKCWDGKWKGLLQSSGAFVYWIKAKTPCSPEPVFRKGTVILIR